MKLNCVLLIDDDPTINFYNSTVIRKSGFAERVVEAGDGEDALSLLQMKDSGEHLKPDLIFLDINMPVMSGWEFLEEFRKMTHFGGCQPVIIMLSSTIDPDDEARFRNTPEVRAFRNKPLSYEVLTGIIESYFPKHA